MTKFLILHGTDATPKSNWFMWLKGTLVGQGHEVWLPQLPGADKPNAKTYTDFIFANKDFVIDNGTVIVGHSSGAVEILNVLQRLPSETTIKGAVLVSAFKDDLSWPSLVDLFQEPFDFDIIKAHCKKFILVHSDNDPHVPLEQAEYLTEKLDGTLALFDGQGHFNLAASPDFKKFPELLEIIETIEE